MATAADMLTSLNAAIAALLAGGGIVEYRLADGTMVRRENLDSLMSSRDKLAGEVAAQSQGMCRPVALRGRAAY